MEFNIFNKNGYLIIEDLFHIEKINLDSIENILIIHHGERHNNKIHFYLSSRIIYEKIQGNFFTKILYGIFIFFHKEKYIIDQAYHDKDLKIILNNLNDNLKNVTIPDDLDKSMFWKTTDNGYSIPMIKLIYSKKGDTLITILEKYNIFKHNEK